MKPRAKQCSKAASMTVLAALAACTAIGHTPPPADWPKLEVIMHEESVGAMLAHCYPPMSALAKVIGFIPLACANINFDRKRCDIWQLPNPVPERVEHERLHCQGYDHVGGSYLADGWAAWKARHQ